MVIFGTLIRPSKKAYFKTIAYVSHQKLKDLPLEFEEGATPSEIPFAKYESRYMYATGTVWKAPSLDAALKRFKACRSKLRGVIYCLKAQSPAGRKK